MPISQPEDVAFNCDVIPLGAKSAVIPGAKMKTKSCNNERESFITVNGKSKSLNTRIKYVNKSKQSCATNTWSIGGRLHRWDVETGVTPDLLFDTGVTFLDSDTEDDSNGPPPNKAQRMQQLPASFRQEEASKSKELAAKALSKQCARLVPQGGRVPSNSQKLVYGVLAQDFVLFGRPRTDSFDHFNILSDEIILQIFKLLSKSQLTKCMEVCKRWKGLAGDESLWKRMDLSRRTLTGETLCQILDRGVLALRLAQGHIQDFQENSLSQSVLQIGRSRLQFLDLSMATITPITLANFLSLCGQLRKLSLENCVLNDEACRHISSNPNLEVLNMSMCSTISPEAISAITAKCQKLHSWNMAWTHLSLQSLDILTANMPSSVRRLNISGCKDLLTEEHLFSLCGSCPSLLELDISNSTSLPSTAVSAILGFQQLHHLHVSHCYSISPTYFMTLGKLRFLRNLDVFGVLNDPALASLRQSLPNVEINRNPFSTVARPTTGIRRTSIWGLSVQW